MKCVKEQPVKRITLKKVVGHRPVLHQKCHYFFVLIKWFRKNPILHIHLISRKIYMCKSVRLQQNILSQCSFSAFRYELFFVLSSVPSIENPSLLCICFSSLNTLCCWPGLSVNGHGRVGEQVGKREIAKLPQISTKKG